MKILGIAVFTGGFLTSGASREKQAARAINEVERRSFVDGPSCEKARFIKGTDP